MKKYSICFEVSQEKTFVIGLGPNGTMSRRDITGTDIEYDFVKILKKVNEMPSESGHLEIPSKPLNLKLKSHNRG